MLYLRICYDAAGMGELRDQIRAEHRAYLKPFVDKNARVRVVQAGPMCTDDSLATNLGSFMIMEAPCLEELERFHDGDPFTVAGIYDRVELICWDRNIGG